jgi:hypothetical protein
MSKHEEDKKQENKRPEILSPFYRNEYGQRPMVIPAYAVRYVDEVFRRHGINLGSPTPGNN